MDRARQVAGQTGYKDQLGSRDIRYKRPDKCNCAFFADRLAVKQPGSSWENMASQENDNGMNNQSMNELTNHAFNH